MGVSTLFMSKDESFVVVGGVIIPHEEYHLRKTMAGLNHELEERWKLITTLSEELSQERKQSSDLYNQRDTLITALQECVVALGSWQTECLDDESVCPCNRCRSITKAKAMLERYK